RDCIADLRRHSSSVAGPVLDHPDGGDPSGPGRFRQRGRHLAAGVLFPDRRGRGCADRLCDPPPLNGQLAAGPARGLPACAERRNLQRAHFNRSRVRLPMSMNRSAVLALLLAGMAMPSFARADDFYKGKTLTIVVGFSPGGGYDVNARTLSRY